MIDASSDEGEKPNTIVGDIEFKDVVFTYPARQDALVSNFEQKWVIIFSFYD